MEWDKGMLEDVEHWERFGKQLNLFLLCAQFDGVGVASFCHYYGSVEVFFLHNLVESVHGCDADCCLAKDAPDDGSFFVLRNVDDIGVCAFKLFFFNKLVFSKFD